MELPKLPQDDDMIETRYGTCFVTSAELLPDRPDYDGKIVCRLP